MNIGYYPIKEEEIKEITKMIICYHKNDFTFIEQVLERQNYNNVNNVDENIEECLNNKNNKYFDTSFGVCIAKLQKIYRGNFILEDKSITQLMQNFPNLIKYKTNLEDIIKFKNNRYMFLNELKTSNSSGIYISFDDIKRLYSDYYRDLSIKKAIDTYYGRTEGKYENKFIKILDYCLQNKCGLLEANFLNNKNIYSNTTKSEQNANENKSINTTNASVNTTVNTNQNINKNVTNNNSTNNSVKNNERRIVSVKDRIWAISGYKFLFGFVISFIATFTINPILSAIKIIAIQLIFAIILSALENFITWKIAIDMAFKKFTIQKEQTSKLMKIVVIFAIISTGLIIFFDCIQYKIDLTKIDNLENKYTNLYNASNTKTDGVLYNNRIALCEEAKKELTSKLYVTLCKDIVESVIYFGTLPYVKKRIEEVV